MELLAKLDFTITFCHENVARQFLCWRLETMTSTSGHCIAFLIQIVLVLTCTERALCFFLAGDFFCRLCGWAVFSPSSLSYIVITATFGRVGLLGLTGVESGNGGSEVSVDMVLSVEELSALSLDLKNKTLHKTKIFLILNWSCHIFISSISWIITL